MSKDTTRFWICVFLVRKNVTKRFRNNTDIRLRRRSYTTSTMMTYTSHFDNLPPTLSTYSFSRFPRTSQRYISSPSPTGRHLLVYYSSKFSSLASFFREHYFVGILIFSTTNARCVLSHESQMNEQQTIFEADRTVSLTAAAPQTRWIGFNV